MVSIELADGWYVEFKNKRWIICKKKPLIIKEKGKPPRDTIASTKKHNFDSLEDALSFYFKVVKLDEVNIANWEDLKQVYQEGNDLVKLWMEELDG